MGRAWAEPESWKFILWWAWVWVTRKNSSLNQDSVLSSLHWFKFSRNGINLKQVACWDFWKTRLNKLVLSLANFKVWSWTELRLGVSGSNPSLGKWISNIWLDCPPPNSLDKAQDSPQYSLHFDGLWLNHVCKSLDWRWNKSQLAKMEASNDDILEAKEIPPY